METLTATARCQRELGAAYDAHLCKRIAEARRLPAVIARSIAVLPDVSPIADRPAVHLHSIFCPTSAYFWAATLSDVRPGDRDGETEFVTILAHSHRDAGNLADDVARLLNNSVNRPTWTRY